MKRILRWAGYGALGLVVLIAAAYGALYGYTEYRLTRTFEVPRVALSLSDDPEVIARGEHVATVRGCVDCHGPSLGGRVFIDAGPVGILYASNLTAGRGGIGATYSDADLVTAIRHGVRPTGKPLLFMPSQEFNVLSDEDVVALVSYIRGLPAVDNELAPSRVGPLGRLLFATGQLPLVPAELIDHQAPRAAAPDRGPTPGYGAYLATGCLGCHGHDLSGGKIAGTPPDFPPAANITPDPETGIGRWSEADFISTLRTGRRPDGTELRPEMPWQLTAQFEDYELQALWRYLLTVPAVRTD
jgi:mono/diheme cytochrome c family protein